MFDSLDEQMKADENKVSSGTTRALFWLLIVLVTIAVFGGLYYSVHLMQGT